MHRVANLTGGLPYSHDGTASSLWQFETCIQAAAGNPVRWQPLKEAQLVGNQVYHHLHYWVFMFKYIHLHPPIEILAEILAE
jgi:hypothetical protein